MRDDPEAARRFWVEHAHYTHDLPFWRGLAARLGSPVLDLGAAAGRVTLALARDGAGVWALDRSPAMLAALRARLEEEEPEVRARVLPMEGELSGFDLGRHFPLILMAMNTLQVLLDPDEQLSCLAACRAHLEPGGELCFDVALPDVGEIAASLGLVRQGERHLDLERGVVVQHSAWYEEFDPIAQELAFTIRIEDHAPDGEVRAHLRHHRVHLYQPAELVHLLARAGLEPVEVLGSFGAEPVGPGSERQIYRCRARGAPVR